MRRSALISPTARYGAAMGVADVQATRRRSRGFTILELLTTIAIIGILAALILPAVGSAREAARRVQCTNQLKQIGLALHAYHEEFHVLPCGWQWEASHQAAYGWLVPLLPLLEHDAILRTIDRNRPLDAPANTSARGTYI